MDADYYGFNRDEEDGTLLAYEAEKEKESLERSSWVGDGLNQVKQPETVCRYCSSITHNDTQSLSLQC